MRCLSRNRTDVYYSQYIGETEIKDENGLLTGQFKPKYSLPKKIRMNVSASRGTADVDIFGINSVYSKTLVSDVVDCQINEDSILWIGKKPDSNGDNGKVKHNYVVVSVARSLNSVTYAVKEVSVS